jgi:hypothetical protein
MQFNYDLIMKFLGWFSFNGVFGFEYCRKRLVSAAKLQKAKQGPPDLDCDISESKIRPFFYHYIAKTVSEFSSSMPKDI